MLVCITELDANQKIQNNNNSHQKKKETTEIRILGNLADMTVNIISSNLALEEVVDEYFNTRAFTSITAFVN
jgi:hypothetical protein